MSEAVMTDVDARQALAGELARINLAVHQPEDPPLFTRGVTCVITPVET